MTHHQVAASTAGHHQARIRPRGTGRSAAGQAHGEHVEHGGDQHRDGRGRVDPAAQADGGGGAGGGDAPPAAPGRVHERDQDPGQHRRGQELGGQPADQGQPGRGEGIGAARRDPGPGRADAQAAREPDYAEERGHGDRADPQPLDDPGLQGGELAEVEERAHREQIADRLILELAELLRIPQTQGPGEEGRRVDGQVELGVGDDPARGRDEREHRQQQAERDQPDPLPDPLVHRGRGRERPGPPLLGRLYHGRSPAWPSRRSRAVAGRISVPP